MRMLNLFDGIGGFALAGTWMGWKPVASVEIDPFCRKVLDYWFDYEHTYGDIKTVEFTPLRGQIDIITGGFPCQPFSNAGKQRGKDDDRYLWPEMLRAIREVQPRWVVGENVRGLLTNAGGMVFEQVCADMEALGYEVQPLLIPACSVDAPHRRDRVWIVAHATGHGNSRASGQAGATPRRPYGYEVEQPVQRGEIRPAADPDCAGQQERNPAAVPEGKGRNPRPRAEDIPGWSRFPTQSPVCDGDDGVSLGLAGIPFPKWRRESLKCLGNSIVPQVAYEIFKAIENTEKQLNENGK